MDSMEPIDPLDGTDFRRRPHRCWDAVHLHALFQLPNRRLSSCVSLLDNFESQTERTS